MADLKEFQSFVSKFVNLWKEVKDAKFQVCYNAGKAMIKLEFELGDVLLLPVNRRVPGPARLRRRERRQEARRKHSAEEAVGRTEKDEEVEKETLDKKANQTDAKGNVKAVNESNRNVENTQIADSDGDIYNYTIFDGIQKK